MSEAQPTPEPLSDREIDAIERIATSARMVSSEHLKTLVASLRSERAANAALREALRNLVEPNRITLRSDVLVDYDAFHAARDLLVAAPIPETPQ